MNWRRLSLWCFPPLLALILYWPGLISWFQKDDFAWLGLYNMIHGWRDFWTVMFHPFAQGTIRTLSERLFFTSFFGLFGMNALPYHILGFVTYMADLTLLSAVCTKLTGSRAAGFWSAVLWTVNGAMAFALAWTAIYYELLCPFFFLLGLLLFMRYAETLDKRFLIAQWIVYLLGFGVLELNVVYPALALSYVLCCARRNIVRQVLPMFVPAILYTAAHTWAAPLNTTGPYRMYWDSGVIGVFWTYWKIALGPNKLILLHVYPSLGRSALAVILTAALVGFLICSILRREWTTVFFATWFVIVLAPLLPLRDHISEYYLTIPLAGLAMWGAWAAVTAWRSGTAGKTAAVIVLAIYIAVGIPIARVNVNSFYARSHAIRAMLLSIVEKSRGSPSGTPIVLTGVEPDMFWSALFHRPLRLYGIENVYIDPKDRAPIQAAIPGVNIDAVFQAPANARIYDVSGGQVRSK